MKYIAFTSTWPLRKIRDTINSTLLFLNSEKLAKIIDGSIFSRSLADSVVTTSKFKNDSVTEDKLADNNITASKILDGSVSENKLEDSVISTNHIALNTIILSRMTIPTQAKVLFDVLSLTSSKFILESVTEDKIYNGSISTIKIKDLSVSNSKIIDDSITTDKILNYSLVNSNISGELINGNLILDNEIPERAIMPSAISLNMLEDKIKSAKLLPYATDIDVSEYWIPNQKFIIQPSPMEVYFPHITWPYHADAHLLEVIGVEGGDVIQRVTPSSSQGSPWSRSKQNGVIGDWSILGTAYDEIGPYYDVKVINKVDSNALADFENPLLRFKITSMGSIFETALTNQYTNQTSLLYTMNVHASKLTPIVMSLFLAISEVMVFIDEVPVTLNDNPIISGIWMDNQVKKLEVELPIGFHKIQILINSTQNALRCIILADIIGTSVSFIAAP